MGCSPSKPADGDPSKTPAAPKPSNNQVQTDSGQKTQASVVNTKAIPVTDNVPTNRSGEIQEDGSFPTDGAAEQKSVPMASSHQTHKDDVSVSEVFSTFLDNDIVADQKLPEPENPNAPVDFPYISGHARAKWPIPCFASLNISTNSFWGGCSGLILCSNSYGGKGEETTAEMILYRGGFCGNHFTMTSIMKDNSGHFGCRNVWVTDENGRLVGDLMFGTNHVAVMTSDPHHGRLSHGVRVQATPDENVTLLPLNVNGPGNTLVLCSGWEAGSGEAAHVSALYMVRSGFKDNFQNAKLIKGTDKWSFSVQDSNLTVSGPSKSTYSLYHNRDENIQSGSDDNTALAGHAHAVNGDAGLILPVGGNTSGVVLLMCSNSSGEAEEATSAALYLLTVGGESGVEAIFVQGSVGVDYPHETADLWTFTAEEDKITVKGPSGPCRYGYLSNLPGGGSAAAEDPLCLASGEEAPVDGAVDITAERVVGWINKPSSVKIVVDTKEMLIREADLKEVKAGIFAFAHTWSEEERRPGLRLVTVAALRRNVQDDILYPVNISGSPRSVTWQAPGVIYAVNCGSQAYEANDGIIYASEFSRFANYSYDFNCGSQCLALGMLKKNVQTEQLIAGTTDGFMYTMHRTPWAEAVDEKAVNYKVEDLPNGKYILRLHTVSDTFEDLLVQGVRVNSKLEPQLKKTNAVIPGCTAHYADVPVTISQNTLTVTGRNYVICSFALFDKSFKPKQKSKEEMDKEEQVKKQLADTIAPLARTMTMKERKLVGWSKNLVMNTSGELGNMSGWNVSGDFSITEGGYRTEKAFITSHMWCRKYQDVVLTEECSAEYLDTAPPIQVSEWYREGNCGGGHYYFRAALLDKDGKVVKEHILPETGRIYKNNKWTEEAVTFTDYGPGVRSVCIESRGKDDKFWGGHYGVLMSAAMVRVRREAIAPEDDRFEDIKQSDSSEAEKDQMKARDQLVSKLLKDNESLLQSLVDDQAFREHDIGRLTQLGHMERPKRRKKREIRVFVSSTFRDFTLEREELIKKTFREVNKACVLRGVFFTYVDLRWGITENQTNHGQTIAICLQEIERCRPYFICMMGDRYGWAQKEEEEDKLLDDSFTYAIENFPTKLSWIEEYRKNTSVTMLEVLHGVLNNVDQNKERSFFYLRDRVNAEDVDADRYKRLVSESDWHRDRQQHLRRMVTENPDLNTRQYKQPLQVCDRIKTDLLWCLEQDFPQGTELTALEREREAHIAFADARCRVYIGREDYFTQITDYVQTQELSPLVIVGESGSGKSALVANWVRRMEDMLPKAFVFVHFIGSSAESASYLKLLKRLYEEMKLFYGFEMVIPQTDRDLVSNLPMWLRMAGAVTDVSCIIVFDAINQLDSGTGDAGAEHDLIWIPRRLPPGVRLVISTLPGRAMDAVTKMGWPQMAVQPLQESEKLQIVNEYLEGIYGKTLNEEQKTMIVESKQSNNPLYLKALLDEVRMFGNFRRLTAKIQEYLISMNPPELFAKILSRFEEDFETGIHKRSQLVQQMTSAIWCSNKGMSEAELLDLLQIPSPVWSPFYLSMVDNLVNRNGILNFFHDHLRQAVEAKYLPTAADKKQGYLDLANFFSGRPADARAAEELPFVLAHAGELDRLKTVISDLTIFSYMIKTEDGKFDLIKSWTLVGGFSQAEEIYTTELGRIKKGDMDPDELAALKQNLAEFFMDLGLFGAARAMLESLVEQVREKYKESHNTRIYNAAGQSHALLCKHPALIDLLYKLGSVCEKQKDFKPALKKFKEAIRLQNTTDSAASKLQLTEGLLGQATVLYLQEDMKEAKKYLLRSQELATEVLGPRHHYVAAISNKLGQLSYKQGRVDEALGYYLHDVRLTRSDVGLGHPRVAGIINDIALVYDDKNDALAGHYYETALQVLLARYGDCHLDVAVIRFNLGSFYFATFSFARAKFQFTEALKVFEEFLGPDHHDTQETQNALKDIGAFM